MLTGVVGRGYQPRGASSPPYFGPRCMTHGTDRSLSKVNMELRAGDPANTEIRHPSVRRSARTTDQIMSPPILLVLCLWVHDMATAFAYTARKAFPAALLVTL
jgi:hypothetical protein